MTYLRHSTRMIHQTIADHVTSFLDDLNWTTEGSVPFQATKVTVQTTIPKKYEKAKQLAPGTVAVTLGDEEAVKGIEVGGYLSTFTLPLFIDCFQDKEGTALGLALDVRDILCARVPGAKRIIPVYDYANDPKTLATGYQIEFLGVTREQHQQSPTWQMVTALAEVTFTDESGFA